MISRLPGWVWFGGSVLSFIAGIINAVGFLSFQHQGVTHLTGTTSALSIAVSGQESGRALDMLAILAAFLVGAALSGFIIQDGTLKLGRRYGVALIVESVLLIAAVPLLRSQQMAGNCLASCACGLQNAMATTYSGATVRTTHVSGLFTDIGVLIGHRLRGLPFEMPRFKLLSFIVIGFFLGGVSGATLFRYFSVATLYLPAALTGLVGLGYIAYHARHPRL